MPIGSFESEILRLLAANRSPDSHIAGATVLNQGIDTPRASEDIDIFHDSPEALAICFKADTDLLQANGYKVQQTSDQRSFKRAQAEKSGQKTKLEWVHDSAFRYFPVEPDADLGYRLNFWDAATNKVLAAASRNAIRDYVDLLELHEKHLALGALVWAAAGKDDGLTPTFLLDEMARLQRYPKEDYDGLRLTRPVDSKALKQIWLRAMQEARDLINEILLDAPYGCFFLNAKGQPVSPTPETLPQLKPHFGSVRGCWPQIVED
jgi:hypothetical protein